MIRAVFAAACVAAVVLEVGMAAAQQNVIKERKDLMKANGAQAKIGADMIKGEKPFDLAAVHKIFATFENAGQKMPGLFPADSKDEAGSPSADRFSPTAKVWQNMADFKARFAKLAADAKAADASVKDLASFKAAFVNIGKNDCGSCHQVYRAKKQS
ncbi:MAG: c-type cytochrome [Xanthobacteraceae bacterium]